MTRFHVCLIFFHEKKLFNYIAHEVIVIYNNVISIYNIVRWDFVALETLFRRFNENFVHLVVKQ